MAYDLFCRTRVKDGHAGNPLEERIHRGFPVGRHGRCHTGQPFLDGALDRGFDIFAGQPGKPLNELIDLSGANIHGPPNKLRAAEI